MNRHILFTFFVGLLILGLFSTSIGRTLKSRISNFTIFAQTQTSINFQPSAPYYATFYYPWSKNSAIDGKWGYWQDGGHTPPNNWLSNYLPDVNPSIFDPATELYSSFDDKTIYWQLGKMKEAKQEVVISSWWGQGHKTDQAFKHIVTDIMNRADNPYPNLRWTVYYEKEAGSNPSVSDIVTDLNYIADNYTQSSAYFKINGKPVIFVYTDGSDKSDMALRWKEAKEQAKVPFYVVLKVYPGFASEINQPDSWHQYAPSVRTSTRDPYYTFVSPGFWKEGVAPQLSRDLPTFETAVQTMVNDQSTWKLTETWNEWGEGSSVEPGDQVIQSKTDKATLNATGAPFKNAYIDVLNRLLPPLEEVTASATPTPISIPTPTGTSADPVLTAAGDIACDGLAKTSGTTCRYADTANIITRENPKAVLLLGDNQYEDGSLSKFMSYFDTTWGKFKAIMYPAVGNHEYITTHAQGYFDYFNGTANQTGPAGDRSKGYYSFDIGTWHLISLNANCGQAGGCKVNSPQEKWLRSDLAAHQAKCVLAFWHQPRFSSGEHGNDAIYTDFWKALYDYNADIVLNGHDHHYERFAPQDPTGVADSAKGIREFIVGTGGKNHYSLGGTGLVANSEIMNTNTYGVIKLTLHPTGYDWNFMPISGSTFTDSGSSSCH